LRAVLLLLLTLLHFIELGVLTRAQSGLAARPGYVPLQGDCPGIAAGGWFVTIVCLPLPVSPLIGAIHGAGYARRGKTQNKYNDRILFHG